MKMVKESEDGSKIVTLINKSLGKIGVRALLNIL
jgi:hypothetical protein